MFPLLQESKNPELYVYGADFSSTAVDVVKSNPNYDEARCKAFVWDLTSSSIPDDIEPESLDFVVLIFVLSAIHPDTWKQAVANAHKVSLVCVCVVTHGAFRFVDHDQRLLSTDVEIRWCGIAS
jgi:tRNAThr (cytosine32-N3)-methyltransferase